MIDWRNATFGDFQVEVQVEEMAAPEGDRLVFPVRVYHAPVGASRENWELAFTKSVPIRHDFYESLRSQPGWREALNRILLNRCRDDLRARINRKDMAIADKVELLAQGEMKVQ
ncbi:MAG: hypothetical protein COV67_09045 [Nitrospinae bacterium CG11_big_fil_rev_8_21_14_0_20_56_8]|nr:MAG: hypothetical protein COV67_09045 [Nitrospinae bacterium CG11_big_fil_rev_8_21_14_0_20_56_8]